MHNPYFLEETLRFERELLDRRNARRAALLEWQPRGERVTVRRRLARALLALADRLDPRTVVLAPHVPARPTLNGSAGHA